MSATDSTGGLRVHSMELDLALAFVAGELGPREFASALQCHAEGFRSLLDDSAELSEGSFVHKVGLASTYEYLGSLDYATLTGALNAQGALARFFDRRGLEYNETAEYSDLFGLILDAQPSWLDVDAEFVKALLADCSESTKTGRKKWLRQRLKEMFVCASKPPRWIQAAEWPIHDGRPLVFLAQAPVKEYFHDDAVAYVFYDSEDGRCDTVLQFY